MKPSPHPTKRPRTQKTLDKDLIRESENEAFLCFKNRRDGKRTAPGLEEKFIKAIKKSPSVHTIDLGILFAVEAGWHKALEELLSVDLSTYETVTSDSLDKHPLDKQALMLFDLPPATHSQDRWYVNSALLHAIVSKKVETVGILARHMNLNVYDNFGEPLLHYVYSLDNQDVKKQIIDIVLPRIEPSIRNLRTASKHGDLESTKYIVERLEPKDRPLTFLAGMEAILNGHDNVAKWIIETPGVVDWKRNMNSLVNAAVRCNNLGMIELLSTRSPAFPLHLFGFYTASDLWAFLQREHRPELFSKFVPSHPEGFTMPFQEAQ